MIFRKKFGGHASAAPVSTVLLLLAMSCSVFATCNDQYTTNPSVDLKCKYDSWLHKPTKTNLIPLLRSLFYVYATDGQDPSMKAFFDGMRKGDDAFFQAMLFKRELIRKYTFTDEYQEIESSGIWAMQTYDARMLFVLSQTDPQSVPSDITAAMYLSIYDEFKRYFCLQLDQDSIGVLPPSEYLRLNEILKRMNWINDPFLKSTNLLYQGLVNINLNSGNEARAVLSRSRELLDSCFEDADGLLSRKRILRVRAGVSFALNDLLNAQADYYRILKIDPNDATALLELSYILTQRGECKERGVWIEASILSTQKEYDVVIHCGNQLEFEEEYFTEPPVIANLFPD
jgi:hypothetical protein